MEAELSLVASTDKETQLAGDGASDRDDPQATPDTEANDDMLRRRKAFVSYYDFLESYWTHFPQSMTKGLGMRKSSLLSMVMLICQRRPSTCLQ